LGTSTPGNRRGFYGQCGARQHPGKPRVARLGSFRNDHRATPLLAEDVCQPCEALRHACRCCHTPGWLGNVSPMTFQRFRPRLTPSSLPVLWNPSPHRSSEFQSELLLLPPRSALEMAPQGITPLLQGHHHAFLLHRRCVTNRCAVGAPSIFGASQFGR